MKIVYDNGEANIKRIPMAYACCDKCEKPIRFAIGFVNEPLVNPWNEEEHKYCEKCGAFMDWKTVNIEKQYETFLAEHDKQIRAEVIEKVEKEIKNWQCDIHDNEYDADKFDFVFERVYEILVEVKEQSK